MNFEDLDKNSNIRPSSLSTVCILTFIGSGLAFLSYFCFSVFFKDLSTAIRYEDVYDSIPGSKDAIEALLAPGLPFFILLALVNAASFCGAYFIWNLKKIGFHIYTLAQIVGILLPLFFGVTKGVPFGSIFWAGLFVALYAVHLKYMQPEKDQTDNGTPDTND